MKKKLFFIIYLFFSLLTFAVFMGVTIGNLIFNIVLTFVVIKRKYVDIYQYRIITFTTLFVFNLASAYLALADKYTPANLEGMFNLSFEVTIAMVWGIIIFGGLLLVYLNDLIIRYIDKTS